VEEQEYFEVIHHVKDGVEGDDEGVARAQIALDEGKGQIGGKVHDGEDKEVQKDHFVLSLFLLYQDIGDVYREYQYPDDTHRSVENTVLAHRYYYSTNEIFFKTIRGEQPPSLAFADLLLQATPYLRQ